LQPMACQSVGHWRQQKCAGTAPVHQSEVTYGLGFQIFFYMPRKPRRGPHCGEHTDAAAAPDLIDRLEEIDDVEPQRHRLGIVGQQKLPRDADIELRVRRHGADIGITAAQPAPAIMMAENRMPTRMSTMAATHQLPGKGGGRARASAEDARGDVGRHMLAARHFDRRCAAIVWCAQRFVSWQGNSGAADRSSIKAREQKRPAPRQTVRRPWSRHTT
jgi:hypothetical protein